jgi:hypothetical protein
MYSLLNTLIWDLQKRLKELMHPTRFGFHILILHQEQREKTVKTGPCFTQLEDRVGYVNEKVGEKRRFRDACNAGGEGRGQGLLGEGGGSGGEKLETKKKKETKHK